MRKTNRGFTIVELVIVIAVIAILAAVLIPTFSGIVQKANLSGDVQVCRNMNTQLATDFIKGVYTPDSVVTAQDSLKSYKDSFLPKTASDGYHYYWNENDNTVCLVYDVDSAFDIYFQDEEGTAAAQHTADASKFYRLDKEYWKVTCEISGVTFNVSAIEKNVESKITLGGSVGSTVKINGTDYTVDANKQITLAANYSGNVVIGGEASAKKNATVTEPTAKTGLVYTGSPLELVNAGTTNGGEWQYKLGDGTYSIEVPTATNAGTYTVYYKLVGGIDYNDIAEASVEVTVTNYLTFTANTAGSTVTPKFLSGTYQYSTNGTDWVDGANDGSTKITLTNVGDRVMLKGNNCVTSNGTEDVCFAMEGSIAASGDITSLTNGQGGDAVLTDYCYNYMFTGCEALTTAPNLPSTTLADYCYASMFLECTSLTTAPALPATNLEDADYCYFSMFQCCTSLVNAPALPATTLAEYCYSYMFCECTSLVNAPALTVTTLAEYCYSYMFTYCAALVNAPALPATTLTRDCYCGMFNYCTSLKITTTKPTTGTEGVDYGEIISGAKTVYNEYSYKEMFANTATGTINYENGTTYYWYTEGNCFTAGTKVTMADNSLKNIENISVGEEVLTFNHEKSIYEAQKVSFVYAGEYKAEAFTLHFDNGSTVSIVGEHDLFEKETLKYVTLRQSTAEEFIGKHFYSCADGKYVELTGVTYETEAVDFYSIYTEYNINCIANGMLSAPDENEELLNIYEINEDLTIDQAQLEADIAEYGLFEYPANAAYPKEYYDTFQIKYANIMVGKGLITWDLLLERISWGVETDN